MGRVWTRSPPQLAQVDWGNSLADKLIVATQITNRGVWDAVGAKEVINNDGSNNLLDTRLGVGFFVDYGSSAFVRDTMPVANLQPPYSLLVQFQCVSTSQGGLFQIADGFNSGDPRVLLQINGTSLQAYFSGNYNLVATNSMVAGRTYTAIFTIDAGGNARLYLDGQAVASFGGGSFGGGATYWWLGDGYPATAMSVIIAHLQATRCWDAGEAAALSVNTWQVFQRRLQPRLIISLTPPPTLAYTYPVADIATNGWQVGPVAVTYFNDTFTGSGALSSHTPDTGVLYTNEGSSLSGLNISGGFLPIANNYDMSQPFDGTGKTTAVVSFTYRVDVINPGDTLDLDLALISADYDWVYETEIVVETNGIVHAYAAARGGTDYTNVIDVTSTLTPGTLHTFTMEISNRVVWKLDGVVISDSGVRTNFLSTVRALWFSMHTGIGHGTTGSMDKLSIASGLALPTALYSAIDEPIADDADYIFSPDNPTTEEFEVLLAARGAPVGGLTTYHSLNYHLRALGLDTIFTLKLVCGSTVLDTWTETVTVAAGIVNRSHAISSGVAATITDYTNVRIRGTAHV